MIRLTKVSIYVIISSMLFIFSGCSNQDELKENRIQGISEYQSGNYEKAKEYFESAVDNASTLSKNINVDVLYYLADTYIQLNQYEDAIKTYERLIKKGEENVNIYNQMGICYYNVNDYDNAVEEFKKAFEKNKSVEIALNLYNAYLSNENEKDANKVLEEIINIVDDNDDIYSLAKVYFLKGDYEKLQSLIEQYLSKTTVEDINKEVYYELAEINLKLNKLDDALNYLNIYFEDNKNMKAYVTYSEYMMKQENYEEALEYINEALQLQQDESFRQLKFNEAVCYEYLGKFKKAYQLFEEYLEKYPDDSIAERELIFLESR